ncbi:HAMP domain-containing protein [Streptomyces spinosirectus]|uniref:ATP-binding protein n=2 Tax=Streptomyces TaxID=1883 RepID=UPI001F3D4B73|nr:ATP-binding protein [Streptomyces spinosirectus]UIR21099.1 HAMP domain-containing protein [Streptomyces spinosirectus]
MSTTEVDAPVRPAPSPHRGGIRGFADRWPFRRKLNLLVGVPLAVVAVLLSYLITDQVGQARDAASAADLVRNSEQVASLVNKIEAEHQLAILLAVRYEAGGGTKSTLSDYRRAQKAVDTQVAKVRDSFGGTLPDGEVQALKEVEGLTSLRGTVEQSYLPASNIDPAYDNAARTVIAGLGLDRNAGLAATFTGNLLDSLLRADAAHGSFETGVFSATTGDTNAQIEFTTAVGAYQLYTTQAERFARFATDRQADELSGIEHSAAQQKIAEAYAELQVAPSTLQATTPARIKAAFQDALADYPAYPQQAAGRLRITSSLIDQIADTADRSSTDAWWRAGGLLAAALLGFVLWLAFSVLVRRSVVRPVQALTDAAQEVAEVAGRELARVADDDAEDAGPPKLREMPVTARDEIGELAEVFNRVQTTSIALLERQVLSRRNVAEMFGNVGRRVSNLTTRQLALIDAVERGETDPALLERLYSIDHIAVRLRRNADSLMLLAGIRETVLDSGPTTLTNVVRAALGQIEGFQRVQLHARTEVMVEPDIIGDLTLMIAELLENAVSFSPAGSPVEVYVRDASGLDAAPSGGATIVVSDHGLGMSAERLAEENARLIRRERLDLVPTKVLGLFVVGTLARRWDVAVALSRTPGGGLTAEVTVPSSLLLAMSPLTSTPSTPAPAASLPPTTGTHAAAATTQTPGAYAAATTAQPPGTGATAGTTPVPGTGAAAGITPASGTQPAASAAPAFGTLGASGLPSSSGARAAAANSQPPGTGATAAAAQAPRPGAAADSTQAPRPGVTAASAQAPRPGAAADSTQAPDTQAAASLPPITGTGTRPAASSAPAQGTPGAVGLPPATGAQAQAAAGAPSGAGDPAHGARPGGEPTPQPGPRPSIAVQGGLGSADADRAGGGRPNPLPRRLPRRDPAAAEAHGRAEDATPVRRDRVEQRVSSSAAESGATTVSAPAGDGTSRPLRRRVRGATLRTTVDAAQYAARQAPRPADPDAVRSALDEFEAAVERANRDSADGRPATTDPQDQNYLPEGAEQ